VTMPTNDIEEWRPVVCAPGHYEVSNLGRVRRALHAPRVRGARPGRILRPGRTREGNLWRLLVSLWYGNVGHTVYVHALVAEAFLGPRPTQGHSVDHIDGDPLNNRLENLRWATPKEQSETARRLGRLDPYGVKKHGRRGSNHYTALRKSG
jgi:HNH endonuclease/NUMOD4 motif